TSRERCLRTEGGFETRPYKHHDFAPPGIWAVSLEMTCVVRATLICFFEAATLSGELVGGMWSTQAQCWRVIDDQPGITITDQANQIELVGGLIRNIERQSSESHSETWDYDNHTGGCLMKKILLASVVLVTLAAAPAVAADISVPTYRP